MNYKVSIIIPIYNTEKYLRRCLDSIVNQDYKNLEIILVNDGSTDSSGKICKEYQQKDSRIKLIEQENKGLSEARNAGIAAAAGQYLSFIDSDDYIEQGFYSYIVDCLNKYIDLDIIQIGINKHTNSTLVEKLYSNINALNDLYDINGSIYMQAVVTWNKVYRKELFDNIKFPAGRYYEDEYTTWKLLYNSNKILISNKQLYNYTINNENSITKKEIKEKNIKDTFDAYLEVIDFFKQKEWYLLQAKSIRRYLQHCIQLIDRIQDYSIKEDILNILANSFKNNKEFLNQYLIIDREKDFLHKLEMLLG